MLPIISIVGPSDSGKTTLIVRLLRALQRKGYHVGVLKHTHARIKVDRAGTDTDRFSRAGAALSAISDDAVLASFGDVTGKGPGTVIAALAAGLDLLIVEGYKREPLPKLLFTDHLDRVDFKGIAATYGKLVNGDRGMGNPSIPHFKPAEVGEIVRWLERTFILPARRAGAVRVTIDGRDLPMKPFVAEMIRETNRGLLQPLKGGKGRNVQIAIDFGREI